MEVPPPPDVSVVMAAFNSASQIDASMASILEQQGVALELIVVNDGSTDSTGSCADKWAAIDPRVRVVHQPNRGLTAALARGCAEARGRFLARQDAGDISLPGRLNAQLAAAASTPNAAIVSVWTRYVGPEGELLYDVTPDPDEAQQRLETTNLQQVRGPSHHGATLFPKLLYDRVGGYRTAFYFAQDLDLWTRLIEYGDHVVVPQIGYQALIGVSSISATNRNRQVRSAKLILRCAERRRRGESELDLLSAARRIQPKARAVSRRGQAQALYFLGECLRRRRDPRARSYFNRALSVYPLHIKSLLRLAQLG